MLVETRGVLDRVAARAGWKRGEIRHRIFRHRYCAARLGTIRHRAEVVEYRVEQHFERLADRLVRLGFDTTTVTTEHGEAESTTPRERETLNGGGEFR